MTAKRDTEAVARGVFAALSRRDLDAVSEYLRDDDVQEFVPLGVRTGSEQILQVFAELFAAMPDLRFDVEDVVVENDRACVRWRLRGTFEGCPFQGILATGRSVDIRGADAMIEVVEGRIAANTIFYDGASFAREIGLLPQRGSSGERLLITAFNLRTRLARLLPGRRGR